MGVLGGRGSRGSGRKDENILVFSLPIHNRSMNNAISIIWRVNKKLVVVVVMVMGRMNLHPSPPTRV